MSLDSVRTGVELGKDLVEACAVLAAAWWFLRQSQVQQRIQFDVACDFKYCNTLGVLAEIRFEFDNKGFVEHRLYDLTLSVHGLTAVGDNTLPAGPLFERRLFPKATIVPPAYKYYFVRPGVHQVITHSVFLRDPG